MNSRRYKTRVDGKFERFELESDDDGRLTADDAAPPPCADWQAR